MEMLVKFAIVFFLVKFVVANFTPLTYIVEHSILVVFPYMGIGVFIVNCIEFAISLALVKLIF